MFSPVHPEGVAILGPVCGFSVRVPPVGAASMGWPGVGRSIGTFSGEIRGKGVSATSVFTGARLVIYISASSQAGNQVRAAVYAMDRLGTIASLLAETDPQGLSVGAWNVLPLTSTVPVTTTDPADCTCFQFQDDATVNQEPSSAPTPRRWFMPGARPPGLGPPGRGAGGLPPPPAGVRCGRGK